MGLQVGHLDTTKVLLSQSNTGGRTLRPRISRTAGLSTARGLGWWANPLPRVAGLILQEGFKPARPTFGIQNYKYESKAHK